MKLGNHLITLRALEPDDVEMLYLWENDASVWRVSNTHTPLSKFMLANYIKSSDKDIWESREIRLIIQNIEGKPVGTVELFDFEPYHNRVGIGIMIYDQSERRKGIAQSALQLIIQYALTELGIFQMYANIAESNNASLELFLKLGFELVGIKKKWLRIPGGWENEHLFQKFL